MAKKKRQQPSLFEMDEPLSDSRHPNTSRKSASPPRSTANQSAAESRSQASERAARELRPRSTQPPGKDDLVIIVDSHSLIYQVFHALPPMTSPNGVPVGAVHGFLRDVLELQQRWQPTHLLCAFDKSEVTFRNELYDQYKAHRDPMPDELRPQIGLIRECLAAMGVPAYDQSGFEADDILATVSAQAESAGAKCLLVTSDKDCRQLLSESVQMLNIRKSEIFGIEQLNETWGITPSQVVDFQSLVGDSVDNVPGVPLIGPKIAQQLIAEFQTLENVLDNANKVSGKKRKENLTNYRDQALLSRSLVELKRDMPLEENWSDWLALTSDRDRLQQLFNDFGFRRLADRFLNDSADSVSESDSDYMSDDDSPESTLRVVFPRDHYQTIETLETLDTLISTLSTVEAIAIDTETTSIRARGTNIVGISIAWAAGHAAYIPILTPESDVSLDLDAVRARLNPILSNPEIRKIGQNLKFDLIVLRSAGFNVAGVWFDTMVADYLLNPGWRNHSLEDIAKRQFDHRMIGISELIGTGKNQRTMDTVALAEISIYACEDVDVPFRLVPQLTDELKKNELLSLFEQLEIPMIEALAEVEFNGISVDVDCLHALSNKFEKQITQLKLEILELADEEFNPDSPKQLAKILFEKLGLPIVKKTRTGASTDVEVLQELSSKHPLPAKIIEYRQATKLKSTYIDSLPTLICEATNRVHTSFRQDVAATGRLSSSDPNLQNIPVRTEAGRQIRSAFRPGPKDWLLLAADYSQIELRVMAHFCGDPNLKRAFEDNLDIHAMVAAQVYEVELDDVTTDMRRNAKAINFGIIYGQSPFGLAKALGIDRTEAADFIEAYFQQYSGVQTFFADTLRSCRKQGYVSTLAGRKRWLNGIRDYDALPETKKRTLIEPERMAINTIIQGSAADLIKQAMIDLHRELPTTDLRAKMLLQIHDELMFEVHRDDLDRLQDLVVDRMANVIQLSVPLRVDAKSGPNWADCE